MDAARDLAILEARARKLAGLPTRIVGARVELLPANPREASRAESVRCLLSAEGGAVTVSLAAFDRVEPPDAATCTLRVGGSANVGEVDQFLRGWALTLGHLSPKTRALSVRGWLEGPHAGLRVVPGNRLECVAMALTVALRGGGLYAGHPAPRSAVGPVLEGLFLGAGGQAGPLLEATLRALPRPEVTERLHAFVERPEAVARVLREALQRDVPVVEAHVRRKARGFLVGLVVATRAFRAERDRAAAEALLGAAGELRPMRPVEERELPFEGELGWDRLAWAVAGAGPLTLLRLSRESVVVAAEGPVKGALALDRSPPPLPAGLLRALEADASRETE